MMIKKITAIALLSAVLFSCSTSNEVVSNGLFQKRKYNKGWYANKSSKIKDTKGDNTKDVYQEESIKQEESIASNDVAKQEVKTISREFVTKSDYTPKQETVLASNENNKEVIKSHSVIIAKQENAIAIEDLKRVVEAKPVQIKEIAATNSGGASGVPLILLVILAILIPPLAVFLVDGIGTKFWISLILTLLFFLPGMIYALLVVFGAV